MTTTHRTKVSIFNEALSKKSVKKMQVFLRVPAQSRTLSLTIQGSETVEELQATISILLGVPKCHVNLTLKGTPLKASLVKADTTIVVWLGGLLGGANKKEEVPDDLLQDAQNVAAAAPTATIKMEEM